MTAVPPQWIEVADTVEVDRKCYYSPSKDKIQWEPRPAEGVERFDDERHGAWRVLCSSAQSLARNTRETKLTNARAYYERGEWDKAAEQFDKAIAIGCGRHVDAMQDNAHVKFVRWEESDGDPLRLQAALAATERSFGLGENRSDPLGLLMAARLCVATGQPEAAMGHLFKVMAVQYLGDALRPDRVWAVLKEVDELTVRLTTRDLEDLPKGARLARDGRSAELVCRRHNTVDHSATFGQMEATVLHAAWALHDLGATDGALRYLEFLSDVPPPGVPDWVLPLLGVTMTGSGIGDGPSPKGVVSAQVSDDGGTLVVRYVNTRPAAITLQVDVKGEKAAKAGSMWLLHSDKLTDSNTPSEPTYVSPLMSKVSDISKGVTVPGTSFVILELKSS